MKKVPFAFHAIPATWGSRFPDGDYTIGRGADPRSAAERAADPDGSLARRKLEEDEAARFSTAKVAPAEKKPFAHPHSMENYNARNDVMRDPVASKDAKTVAAPHVLGDASAGTDANSTAGSTLAQKSKKASTARVTSPSRGAKT